MSCCHDYEPCNGTRKDCPARIEHIEMFEPSGWIATMEWLQHTIVPCLVSLVVGAAAATIYFLRG